MVYKRIRNWTCFEEMEMIELIKIIRNKINSFDLILAKITEKKILNKRIPQLLLMDMRKISIDISKLSKLAREKSMYLK